MWDRGSPKLAILDSRVGQDLQLRLSGTLGQERPTSNFLPHFLGMSASGQVKRSSIRNDDEVVKTLMVMAVVELVMTLMT